MTCRQLRPYVVDCARGGLETAVESRVARHVRGCPDCRALLERERIMSAALRRMADQIRVPAVAPDREEALLTLFDEAGAKPRRSRLPVWLGTLSLAAVLLIVVVAGSRSRPAPIAATRTLPELRVPAPHSADVGPLTIRPPDVVNRSKRRWSGHRGAPPAPARPRTDETLEVLFDTESFVAWPWAAAGPRLESGAVIRVSLPVSILPALGLWPPPSAGRDVPADLLVGQDGFARAVRLVSD